MLLDDIRAKRKLYSERGPAASLAKALLSDGTSAIILYRLMSALARYRLVPLALVVQLINKWMNGCVIGMRARFGPGFVLIHPIGVVINSRVRGGANIWIESGVVIGENRGACPELASDIFIGSGAKVVGALRVGAGAKIGANAVVLHDVDPGSTVVGIPARPVVRRPA